MKRRLRNWFRFEAGRVEYRAFEWWVMRAGFALLVWQSTPPGLPYPEQPGPVGIAKFIDLTVFGQPHTGQWMAPLVTALCAVYALGLFPLLSALGLLVLHTGVATLALSQGGGGGSHHATQIIGAVLLAHVLGTLYVYAGILRRSGAAGLAAEWRRHWAWPRYVLQNPGAALREADGTMEAAAARLRSTAVYAAQQLVACGYVASGVSKLWRSEGEWVSQVVNIPLQFEKNRLNEYHDKLIELPPGAPEQMARWIGEHPALAGLFFSAGLFLELFCFLALWNRRLLIFFGGGLIVMHSFISVLMNLGFYYNKMVLLLFFVNVPFWLWLAFRGRGGSGPLPQEGAPLPVSSSLPVSVSPSVS